MEVGPSRLLKKYFLSILTLLIFSLIHNVVAQSGEAQLGKEGKKGHPKIASALFDLKEKYLLQGSRFTQNFAHRHHIQMDEQDSVVVLILPAVGKTKGTINVEKLKAYGGEVIKSGNSVIKAKVPILMVDAIADDVEGISFIKLPDRPFAAVTSEGVDLTGASLYHSSGYVGQYVNVAVIDGGFAGLSAAIASGEVPSSVITIDCTGTECVPTDFSSETMSHGTAVAEVIYDMAPGAQLYLIKIEDSLDLMDAKDYCIANGIRIINHSMGWFNTNFYDGACYFDNPVCTANHAYRNGILWVNSAGNHAKKHYTAVFTDRDGNQLHNVTGSNNYISLYAQAGEVIGAALTWDAWPVTDQDYDFLLFNSAMELVGQSSGIQNGTQQPSEEIVYAVPTTGTYYLAVKKFNAATNHRFKIFSLYHDLNPYVGSSSLLSPSDATGVMAVAAIHQANWATGPQEEFSSQGPTTDGRIKPDISGPDEVSNSVYGSFSGTSASAPHAAGAAALILSNNPYFDVSQLWDAMIFSAIDMGPYGQDTIYGYGRLNLSTIYVYPGYVDFGNVIIPNMPEGMITIQNIGSPYLEIGAITSPSYPFEIVWDNCSYYTLGLGESCNFMTRFSPMVAGTFTSSFDIPSNDPYRNPVTVSLFGKGIYEITLSSPSDETTFSTCSAYFSPTFQWKSIGNFKHYDIQFSTDPTFTGFPPFSIYSLKVPGGQTVKGLKTSEWKIVLQISGFYGGFVYWRVVGSQTDGTQTISNIRSVDILYTRPIEEPMLYPVTKNELPTLTWQNNCNIKFKVWFGSDEYFSNKKAFVFRVSDPTLNDGIFSRELTLSQWKAIRRLVGDVSGSTIYWYVESWDCVNRQNVSEIMSFILMD